MPCSATPSGAVCAGSNPAGGADQKQNSNAFTITAGLRHKSVTCGDTAAFQALRPMHAPVLLPDDKFPAQRRSAFTACGPFGHMRPLLLRPSCRYPVMAATTGRGRQDPVSAGGRKEGTPSQTVARLLWAYDASLLPDAESVRLR